MQEGLPIELSGRLGFVSKANPKASLDAISEPSKNVGLDAEGSLVTVPAVGGVDVTISGVPAGATGRRARLHGGKRALASSPGNSTATRGGLSCFSGTPGGGVRWEGGSLLNYLSGFIISITDGTNDAPLGLPVPPAPVAGSGTPAAGEYVVASGGNIKKTIALKWSLYRKETNSESWLSQSTGPIVVPGSGAQIQVRAPNVPATYDVGTFYIRIYAPPQGTAVSPLAQYYRVAEIAPGALATLNFTDADLGALAPYTADSPSGTWTDPAANPGKYGMPPAATWLAATGAHLLTIGDHDPPTGHLYQPSVAFSIDTFDPSTVGVANPTEPFLDIVENANDGYILGLQKNAVGFFILTGASDYPVIYRAGYRSLGVKSKHQIATVSGEIFAWARKRGLVRSGPNDQPDSTFTYPVRAFLPGFTSDPLIGYDLTTDRVCVVGLHSNPFGDGPAWCVISYERGLPGDVWTSPAEITGFTPEGIETWDNDCYLTDASGNWRKVFGGTSARSTVAQFAPQTAGVPSRRKDVTSFEVSASATPDVAITSGRTNTVKRSHAAVPLGAGGSSGLRNTYARGEQYVSMRITLPTGGTIDGGGLICSADDAAV